MSKVSKLAKDVPSTEDTFPIEVEGDTTKKRFLGEFTCRIPNRKVQCMIDKHRAFLNGGLADQLSEDTLKFHHMISYLRYTVTESPKWWKEADLGYELYDENVVKAVYDKVLDFEVKWLKEMWGEEAVAKLQAKSEERDAKEGDKANKEATA